MKLNSVIERAMLLGAYPILALTLTGFHALAGIIVVLIAAVLSTAVWAWLRHLLPQPIAWLSVVAVGAAGGMAGALLLPYVLPLPQSTRVLLAIAAITPISFVTCRQEHNEEAEPESNLAVLLAYVATMLLAGVIREILADGTLFGFLLTPDGAIPAGIVGTPVGGFLFLGTVFVLLRVSERRRLSADSVASSAHEGVSR
ncbi:MAG: hypothetical protein ACLFM0_10045 [Spirochaetales bacterium]